MREDSKKHPAERLANGLGWFSIGLGLAELLTPSALARVIGIRNTATNRKMLRAYGLRELGAGVGILSQACPVGWIWARVAGDALDLTSLAAAFGPEENSRLRVAVATAAVLGVTALDLACGQQLSAPADKGRTSPTTIIKTIIVNRSQQEAYNFWRNFENLPTFMSYLHSVRNTGGGRSHWVALGPAGRKIEWDAEVTADEPAQRIAWRSVAGAVFRNAGAVSFERAPGNRGTLVRVELDYSPDGGVMAATVGGLLGADIGQRIAHDLRNFKQVLELGEVTQSDASIHEGMHSAQPAMSAQ